MDAPKTQRRKQHYIAKFHLRRFGPNDAQVWQFDCAQVGRPPVLVSVNDAAAQRDLYAPGEGDEPKSDVFEQWLDVNIDGPAAPAFVKVIEGLELNGSERSAVARYVLTLDVRTPRAREFLLRHAQRGLQAHLDERLADVEAGIKSIKEADGIDLTVEEYEELRRKNPVDVEVTPAFWLNFVSRNLSTGARRIFEYQWVLAEAPSGLEFVMSDIGIVKYADGFYTPRANMLGWSNQTNHWFLPLTPKLGLAIGPGRYPRVTGSGTATRDFVKAFNRSLVFGASRWVFCRQPFDFVGRWVGQRSQRT